MVYKYVDSSCDKYITDVFNGLNNDFSTPTFGDDLYFHIRNLSSEKKAHRYTIGANFDTSSETWSFGLGYGLENRKEIPAPRQMGILWIYWNWGKIKWRVDINSHNYL